MRMTLAPPPPSHQLYAILKAIALTSHVMSPANRTDRITQTILLSNEEWKARQALLMSTQYLTAVYVLPKVTSKLLECGKALGLFQLSATILPSG